MRLHNVMMATHLLTGAVCAMIVGFVGVNASSVTVVASVGFAASLTGLAVGFFLANRLVNGLAALERTMASGDVTHLLPTGIVEFERLGERMRALIAQLGRGGCEQS